MNRVLEALEKIRSNEKEVVVWTYDGIIQGRAYRKEREVADYINDMLKLSPGRLQVVIEKV